MNISLLCNAERLFNIGMHSCAFLHCVEILTCINYFQHLHMYNLSCTLKKTHEVNQKKTKTSTIRCFVFKLVCVEFMCDICLVFSLFVKILMLTFLDWYLIVTNMHSVYEITYARYLLDQFCSFHVSCSWKKNLRKRYILLHMVIRLHFFIFSALVKISNSCYLYMIKV